MKIFCIIKNGIVNTVSSHPISENGALSTVFEVDPADFDLVATGKSEFILKNDKLELVEKKYDEAYKAIEASKKRKMELLSKIVNGSANKEEQEEFANLI